MSPETQAKYEALTGLLTQMESVAVAYSGGVDSAFLAHVAQKTLGESAHAVLGVSPTVARSEMKQAREFAASFGLQLTELTTEEIDNPDYASNPVNRCYFCKSELFGKLAEWTSDNGIRWIADGSNADDKSDWRPGSVAAEELSVRSPLAEIGLTKAEIREISREFGLPTWDKPSIACLGSRFPYGTEITIEKIRQLDDAEDLLRDLGFRQIRVRHHGDIARIEVEPDDIERLASAKVRQQVVEGFQKIGFKYVTLDLAGYVRGSLNIGFVENITAESARPV